MQAVRDDRGFGGGVAIRGTVIRGMVIRGVVIQGMVIQGAVHLEVVKRRTGRDRPPEIRSTIRHMAGAMSRRRITPSAHPTYTPPG